MSRDIPIIFSKPMVLALLEGRKTMTRRLAWRLGQPSKQVMQEAKEKGFAGVLRPTVPTPWQNVKSGDRLWVRENFARNANQISDTFMDTSIVYDADGRGRALDNGTEKPWTPCIHMPRWASRLTLVVTEVKTERLQNISDADAIKEGVESDEKYPNLWRLYSELPGNAPGLMVSAFPRISFRSLWASLHGPQSWETNPDVVALSFTVHCCNIDKL